MEFDPFARRNPEISPDEDWESLENQQENPDKKIEKTAKIRKMAVSQAIDPSVRGRQKTPELSAQRHPEAFHLQPVMKTENTRKSYEEDLQLTTPDLLKVAASISLEGTNVRKLYESNQIDYRGLHAIVSAALRGESIQSAFKKHKLGEEAQRGRKIEMRHDNPTHASSDQAESPSSRRVESMINQLETASHNEKSSLHSDQKQSETDESEIIKLSKQKANSAIKTKRLLITMLSIGAGVATGTLLALFILN